jgi:signal recognition particle receptor subunit beta
MRQILPTIVVIGFMGAGKTSVGRLVARALGREFVDTDLMIERAARMTIAELFQREGELSFRRREMAAIDRAISVPGRVIAVGTTVVRALEATVPPEPRARPFVPRPYANVHRVRPQTYAMDVRLARSSTTASGGHAVAVDSLCHA